MPKTRAEDDNPVLYKVQDDGNQCSEMESYVKGPIRDLAN